MSVTCNHCATEAVLVNGQDLYGYASLKHKLFWQCQSCGAYVGCHPPARANGKGGQGDGTVPLGTLANPTERRARSRAHAAFDSLWQPGGPMKRKEAYAWLAGRLGLSADDCHIGMFDPPTCERVCNEVAEYFRRMRGGRCHTVPAGTFSSRARP